MEGLILVGRAEDKEFEQEIKEYFGDNYCKIEEECFNGIDDVVNYIIPVAGVTIDILALVVPFIYKKISQKPDRHRAFFDEKGNLRRVDGCTIEEITQIVACMKETKDE